MKLSWIEKERFYHEVAQYVKSGITLQDALQSIGENGDTAKSRRMANRLLKDSRGSESLYATFTRLSAFSELELALVEAAEQSGRLEQVFRYLGEYFQSLHEARQEIIRRAMYPLFILHFAVFLMPLPQLLTGKSTVGVYLAKSVGLLLLIYAAVCLVCLLFSMLTSVSRRSRTTDKFMRMLPLVGKVRSSSAFSRFCLSLEMQLQAGISPLIALPVAGRASQSGLILGRANRAVPRIDAGADLADALGKPGPLPANVLRGIRLGQQAGSLDEELRRWGTYYRQETLNRIRVLSDWLPKIMYLFIAGYAGYRIVDAFRTYMEGVSKLIEGF